MLKFLKGGGMKAKILTLLLFLSTSTLAAVAIPGERSFYQSDGLEFTGELKGDEWFNWVEDEHGRVIQYNPASYIYEYSILVEEDGALSLNHSGIAATDSTPLSASLSEIGIINRIKLYKIGQKFRQEALQYSQEGKAKESN